MIWPGKVVDAGARDADKGRWASTLGCGGRRGIFRSEEDRVWIREIRWMRLCQVGCRCLEDIPVTKERWGCVTRRRRWYQSCCDAWKGFWRRHCGRSDDCGRWRSADVCLNTSTCFCAAARTLEGWKGEGGLHSRSASRFGLGRRRE